MLMNNESFDKLIVMRQLAWDCIVYHDKNVGVVLPNFNSVKKFKSELAAVLGEIPHWLLQVKVCNMRSIITANNVKIMFFNDIHSMRGISLDVVFVAHDLPVSSRDEFATSMIPTLVDKNIMVFQND